MEEDGVLVDVLQEVLVGRFPVLIKLNLTCIVVKIQHSVQRMVIELFALLDGFCHGFSNLSCGHVCVSPCDGSLSGSLSNLCGLASG